MTTAYFLSAKSFYIMIYGLFGVFCICTSIPSVNRRLAGAFDAKTVHPAIVVAIAAGIMFLGFAVTGSHLLVAATMIGTMIFAVRHAAWRTPLTLLTGASTITLVLSLVWWRIEPSPAAPLSLAAFSAILGGLAIGFSDVRGSQPNTTIIQTIVFLLAGFLLLIDLGGYRPGEPVLEGLAHHWGAFIGPALHIKAGLVPFYDIPIQYGLGPTLALVAACRGSDCWTGMEVIVVVLNLAHALLILRMALTTIVPRGRLWYWTATIVVFAAVFLWPGFPSNGSSLIAFPSSSAVRFLPATLVACLLFIGHPRAAAVALVPAVLWSPESAAMSMAVFGLCEAARIGFVRAALCGAGLLTGCYAGLVLLHRATFGVWMDPAAFVEYVLHVPSPLPINPFSDAMLLAAVLGLGGWLMVRPSPDPVACRRDRAAVFLLFATTSYWFGRSHPNNICNLAPFLMLVACRVLDRPRRDRSLLADVTSFGLATSVAALVMSPWRSMPFDPRGTVDIHAVVADFSSVEPDIERLRGQIVNPDGLGIADFGPHFLRHPSEKLVWTPMDPSSLWSFVPSERRQLYIRRSSTRLRRAGWAIVYDDQRFLFDDLHSGYTVAEQHSFNGAPEIPGGPPTHYVAACFNPRSDVVASIVGPACPLPASRAP